MGTDVSELLPCPHVIKVHSSMCTELSKLINKISKIFPEIEAAGPRCSSGIQALCLLNIAIEKAKALLQNCSESSKLYLAITGDAILSRCKKTRNLLEQSLSQVESMVPISLAAKISPIVDDLKVVTFILDSSEEEAGKVMRAFLQQYASATDSVDNSSIEAIQFAATRLNITSQKALLIEKRSIKKLLDKVGDSESAKKQILLCLLSLLKKYGQIIVGGQKGDACVQSIESSPFATSRNQSVEEESRAELGRDEPGADMLITSAPPEEYKCPMSMRLMYDPVVIASGQTFEKMWIQKWFDEGHSICPKTKRKLAHLSLTPNTVMRDLISKWCNLHGVSIPDPCIQLTEAQSRETSSTSIASLSGSMNNLRLPLDFSNVSLGSSDTSYSDSSHVNFTDDVKLMPDKINGNSNNARYYNTQETQLACLPKLDELSWGSQCKAVKDVKSYLEDAEEAFHLMASEAFVLPIITFLKQAHRVQDVKAQITGSQLLFAFISKCRGSFQFLPDETYSLLALLLNSELNDEVLAIIEVFSLHQYSRRKLAASGALTSVVEMLDTEKKESQERAIKILHNVSSDGDIHSLVVSLKVIPKLVPLFEDPVLARYGITVLKNLCDNEDARASIAETDVCIASVSKLLESENCEEQELAVAVLLSLCSQDRSYCQLVMSEGVIPALVSISVNGNNKGKASAMELLRVLRDIEYGDLQENSGSGFNFSGDSNFHCKEKISSSKATGFFRKKMTMFTKARFLASEKKR